jgi:starch synthase
VPFEPVSATEVEPQDPDQFSRGLAAAANVLLADPGLRAAMGRKARRRVEEEFSWTSIARQTLDFYQQVVAAHRNRAPETTAV